MRRPHDARQHGLTSSQGPFALPTARMLVIIVIVLRLDVAVLEVFVLMNGAAHARRFLGLGGKLERDLES